MPHVFISYARKDGKELAFKLYGSFNALEGWSAWLDVNILVPRPFTSEIEREIKRSDAVVVVLSPDVERADSFVRKEIAFAQMLDKPIFPIRIGIVVPPVSIADLTWLDFSDGDYQELFSKLLNAIQRSVGTTFPSPPPKPDPHHSSPLKLAALYQIDSRLDFEWSEVAAGRFKMGGDAKAANAWQGKEFILNYPFWIAKFPVTYAQYEPFVEVGGYKERRYWTRAGWLWKEKEQVYEPLVWRDPTWHRPNRPIVGISWYEAYAYTQWLNSLVSLPSLSRTKEKYVIRLLRECEWEKAARYPDGRLWPWGDDWEEGKRINWQGTGLGRPSAVGEFPEGTHPILKVQDLVGNVWEWCLTKWSEHYYSPGVEDNCPEGTEMRCARGGSWSVIEVLLRPAGRSGSKPNDRFLDWGMRLGIAPALQC